MSEKKKAIWIGIEIPTSNGTYKICIGINKNVGEDYEHEVSFCNGEDIKLAKKYDENPWITDGEIIVKDGDAMVFDENHNLIVE